MGKNYDNDEMEIDLLELFYVLKSKILAILGVGLLFGCIACAYAGFLVKPLYTSSSMMLVLTKETTLSSLADLQVGFTAYQGLFHLDHKPSGAYGCYRSVRSGHGL